MERTEGIFGASYDVAVKSVASDEDKDYPKPIVTLYELLKTKMSAVKNESKESSDTFDIRDLDDEFDEFRFELEDVNDIDEVEEVEIDGVVYIVPTCREVYVKNIYELVSYTKYLEGIAVDWATCDPQLLDDVQEIGQFVLEYKGIRMDEHLKNQKSILLIQMYEIAIKHSSKKVSEKLKNSSMKKDPVTGETWLLLGEDMTTSDANSVPTLTKPITRSLHLNSNLFMSLCQMMFSKVPVVRAHAKIELNADLNSEVMDDAISEPGGMLTAAIAEAKLTAMEVLAVVFPVKKRFPNEQSCFSCDTTVHISDVFIHRKCKVVQWLCSDQPFRYDPKNQRVIPIKRNLMSPQEKLKVQQILEMHARLNCDVVCKKEGKTTYWKRQDSGVLLNIPALTRKAEDIIGSVAWKKSRGFIVSRNKT